MEEKKGGMKINHTIQGKGPCIVFLHGLMESLHIWDSFSELLSDYFCVIAIDLPGHGDTPSVADNHPMNFMASCVEAILKAYDIEEAVLIGHSMGGYVALEFAKLYPDMVKGLVLFNSKATADTETQKEGRDRVIKMLEKNKVGYISSFFPELFTPENRERFSSDIDQMVKAASKMDPQGIIAAQAGMRDREDSLELLAKIDVPVLFVVGKKDPRCLLTDILAQASIPKHAEIVLLDDVGHVAFVEARERTFDIIESFADRCYNY